MKYNLKIVLTIFIISCFFIECNGKEFQEIKVKQEVIEKVNQLFIYTDERDWRKVESVFAEKVLFDMTSLAGGKPAELKNTDITSAWDKGLKNLKAIHHQAGNYLVTINGDSADVFCYATAIHYLPNKTNQNTRTFVGSYNIHLVKTENWKIDKFKFNVKYVDGNMDLNK